MGQKLYPTCLQKRSFFLGLVQCLTLSGVGSLLEDSESLIKSTQFGSTVSLSKNPTSLEGEEKFTKTASVCVLSLWSDMGFRFEPDCLLFRQNLLGMATWFWPAALPFSSPGPGFA